MAARDRSLALLGKLMSIKPTGNRSSRYNALNDLMTCIHVKQDIVPSTIESWAIKGLHVPLAPIVTSIRPYLLYAYELQDGGIYYLIIPKAAYDNYLRSLPGFLGVAGHSKEFGYYIRLASWNHYHPDLVEKQGTQRTLHFAKKADKA